MRRGGFSGALDNQSTRDDSMLDLPQCQLLTCCQHCTLPQQSCPSPPRKPTPCLEPQGRRTPRPSMMARNRSNNKRAAQAQGFRARNKGHERNKPRDAHRARKRKFALGWCDRSDSSGGPRAKARQSVSPGLRSIRRSVDLAASDPVDAASMRFASEYTIHK